MLAPQKNTLDAEAGSLRELLRVALPLAISSGSLSLMHVVDRIFLTWYSKEALAAGMPAGILNWTLMSFALGTAGYVNAFVAQYEGAGKPERVAAAVWQGIYFSVAASIAMLVFVPLAPAIFALFRHDPAVQQLEIEYFSILTLGAGPFILSAALSCFYSGRGQTQVIMVVNITTALTNVLLDYLLIFGSFGFPELGIRGAAVGTVLASLLGAIMYIVHMLRSQAGREYALWPPQGVSGELMRRLFRFGVPSGVHLFMDVACFTMFIQVVGLMGTDALASTNLAFNLNSLAFVPMMGVGTAVMTLTGQRIGEGRPELAVRTTWIAFALAAAYMGVFACIYFFAPGVILRPYAAYAKAEEFRTIEAQVTVLLRYVAIYSVFDAMVIIFSSATRGAGDTRFALLFSTGCGLLLMVLPTYVAFHYFGLGLGGAWASATTFIIIVGLGFMARFYWGPWKSMRVIEGVPPAGSVAG